MGRKFKNIDFNEKVAKQLRDLRMGSKLTPRQIGKLIKIHETSIRNHESGLYCHDLYTILNYCKFYKITINEFLEGI